MIQEVQPSDGSRISNVGRTQEPKPPETKEVKLPEATDSFKNDPASQAMILQSELIASLLKGNTRETQGFYERWLALHPENIKFPDSNRELYIQQRDEAQSELAINEKQLSAAIAQGNNAVEKTIHTRILLLQFVVRFANEFLNPPKTIDMDSVKQDKKLEEVIITQAGLAAAIMSCNEGKKQTYSERLKALKSEEMTLPGSTRALYTGLLFETGEELTIIESQLQKASRVGDTSVAATLKARKEMLGELINTYTNFLSPKKTK